MDASAKEAVLDRMFAAIPRGDIDTMREIYAPDAEIWHNSEGATQTVEQNLVTLAWVARKLEGLRYEDIQRTHMADGRVLQQHVLRGKAPNGTEVAVLACITFTFRNGRIVRLEEYFDSNHIRALREPAVSNTELARRFFDAVAAGDAEGIRAVVAPDGSSWQNARGTDTSFEQVIERIGALKAAMPDFHYEDIRCQATADGFVEVHNACGTSPSGKPFSVPACVIGTVKDGRIVRMEEYVDSAHGARMRE